ncbi:MULTISPECIES: hypothetical protein [Streptacidiphilus]|uniref:Secreted protein n=1 Tax=Streptacidiphilus cavernicola TaxID=3342716 RepID=A0ABV6UIT6_9ACTN|nr:hypothetical protein [Streptacidiphilus jeojiense]
MSVQHRPGRRASTIAIAVSAVLLTGGLVAGCDGVNGVNGFNSSVGCFGNAGTIADSLIAIHEAGLDSSHDPTRTHESIDTINRNLAEIGDGTDDAKVNKAVDNLNKAIADYNRDILNGDTSPDSSRIDAAAAQLRVACTS